MSNEYVMHKFEGMDDKAEMKITNPILLYVFKDNNLMSKLEGWHGMLFKASQNQLRSCHSQIKVQDTIGTEEQRKDALDRLEYLMDIAEFKHKKMLHARIVGYYSGDFYYKGDK